MTLVVKPHPWFNSLVMPASLTIEEAHVILENSLTTAIGSSRSVVPYDQIASVDILGGMVGCKLRIRTTGGDIYMLKAVSVVEAEAAVKAIQARLS